MRHSRRLLKVSRQEAAALADFGTLTSPAKTIHSLQEVIAGPETARRLGVPEGSVVQTVELYWHRNPMRRVWWRLTGRKG